jgi:hypothetical protein
MHAVLALDQQNSQHPHTQKRRHIDSNEKEVAQLQPA